MNSLDCCVYSFDCWGTIINSNKRMWADVSIMFRDIFEIDEKYSLELISEICKNVNKKLDADTSINEKEHDQLSRIGAVSIALGVKPNSEQIRCFVTRFEKYLHDNDEVVILIDSKVFDYIYRLKNEEKSIILLSNSGFISGKQTRYLLEKLNLLNAFNEIYLSDEIGFSKPSTKIYKYVIDDLIQKGYILNPNEMVHIGDNRNLDYLAALYNGLCAVHIDLECDHKDTVNSIVKFSMDSSNKIISCSTNNFTAFQYSRFKFGVISEIYNAAVLMSDRLVKQYSEIIFDNEPPVFVEAYKNIVPASVLLVRAVKKIIDLQRLNLGLCSSITLHVKRKNDNLDSYACLHAHKRNEALFDDCYLEDNKLNVTTPIFILDDMYVSGVFAKKIKKTLLCEGFSNLYYLFVADCQNSALSGNMPIEQEVNCVSIQKLSNLEYDMNTNNFIPTRKYYKLLLSSRYSDITNHLSAIPKKLQKKIYLDLVSVSDELHEKYKKNCCLIKMTIKEKYGENR